jgi:hypothetical protein
VGARFGSARAALTTIEGIEIVSVCDDHPLKLAHENAKAFHDKCENG